jgi:hypothetical protein
MQAVDNKHTTKLPCNFKKNNAQATGPGGCISIPKADTMVERPNLVQNRQILPSSCLNPSRGIDAYCIKVLVGGFGKAKNALKCTILS